MLAVLVLVALLGLGQTFSGLRDALDEWHAEQRRAGARDTVTCVGDGTAGNRIQLVSVHRAGTADRFDRDLRLFRTLAAGADDIVDRSARETGGRRHLRYVHDARCRPVVARVEAPADPPLTVRRAAQLLRSQGYDRPDRKYLMFLVDAADPEADPDEPVCGTSLTDERTNQDDRPGPDNAHNRGPSFAMVNEPCWDARTMAHELAHSLGAVLPSAPHATEGGHCTDGADLLCYPDAPGVVVRTVCPPSHALLLDCGHDDYFSTAPRRGSWLATHWNIADSSFLLDPEDAGAPATSAVSPSGGAATGGRSTSSSGPARRRHATRHRFTPLTRRPGPRTGWPTPRASRSSGSG